MGSKYARSFITTFSIKPSQLLLRCKPFNEAYIRQTIFFFLIFLLPVFIFSSFSLTEASDLESLDVMSKNAVFGEPGRGEQRNNKEKVCRSAKKLVEAIEHGEDVTTGLDNLLTDIESLKSEESEIQTRFQEIEQKLQSIGAPKALLRHQKVLDEYKRKSSELKGHCDAVKGAKHRHDHPEVLKQKVKGLIDFIEKNKPEKDYDLKSTENRLPWSVVEPGDLILLGDSSSLPQGSVSLVSSEPPTGDDLSETVDVQITPEIQELAGTLDNHPLKIFRYVYNNYDYTPYYGSMKGSLDTYWEKEGNDYDLASLLITLLRASDIPARYVRAEILIPIEKLQKWLRINDTMSALNHLESAKIPFGYYSRGGRISHVKLEHVYVEAFIPYSNYRGTGNDDTGKLWIPLDPSLKEYRILQEGLDIASEMGFDWKVFSDEYLAELRNITPLEFYMAKIDNHIADNHPGQTLETLKRVTEIRNMQFDFLPNTLPYVVLNVLGHFSEIPQELRHILRFQVGSVLDLTVSLPKASGRRITLSFTGATAEDQELIEQFGGIFKTPPYLVEVKPILRINGNKVVEGLAMDAGIPASFSIDYTQPGGDIQTFDHNIITGSFNAVGITIGKVRPEYLSISTVEDSEEVYMAKMLHSLAMKFHHRINLANRLLNDSMKMHGRVFFNEALVSSHQKRETILGDVPASFELSGFKIDAKAMSTSPVPVDSYDKKKVLDFAMVGGYEGSYQENRIFEDNMFWLGGLSAVKGLQMLKAMGVEIIELEPYQVYSNPDLPAGVVSDINDALNMGWNVIAPAQSGGLPVIPYIKYDRDIGSAGYMIATAAGGLAYDTSPIGHETDLTFIKDSFESRNLWIDYEVPSPVSPVLVAFGGSFLYKLISTVGDSYGAESSVDAISIIDTDWTHYKSGAWPMYALLPGEYKLKFDGEDLLVFRVWRVFIDSDASDRYLGISTDNGVDTINDTIEIIYAITDLPGVNLTEANMKIYDSSDTLEGTEIRTISLPLALGKQTVTWDGKDDSGQVVAPGEYSIVIEAVGSGGRTESKKHGVTVFKVEIFEVNTPSDIANPPGENSFVAPENIIEVRARVIGAPELEPQINWRAEAVGDQAGQANPESINNTNIFSFNASSLLPTSGSNEPNPPLEYEVIATVSIGETTFEDRVPPLSAIRQDERDIIRQEYIDFGIMFQLNRPDIAEPDQSTINSDVYNDGNYNLMINGILPDLKRDFVAELNNMLTTLDQQVVALCPCSPEDQQCRDENPYQCRLSPLDVVIQAGTIDTTRRPPNPSYNRVVIIFHSVPGGDDVYCAPNTGETSTTVVVGGFICAGPNGMADTIANTITFTSYNINEFYVTSGFRNPRRNTNIGSNSLTSMHPRGRALDIRTRRFAIQGLTSANPNCIIELAGDRAVGAINAFIEIGGNIVPCDDPNADHLHFQLR